MRGILFRGKRADNGKWVYGFYVYIPCASCDCGKYLESQHLIQTIRNNGRIGILYKVIPDTIGQYTGLKDKNGNKIFDGDIVKIRDYPDFGGDYGVVRYEVPECCYVYDLKKSGDRFYLEEYDSEVEVIGNIHDNPELLEVSEYE